MFSACAPPGPVADLLESVVKRRWHSDLLSSTDGPGPGGVCLGERGLTPKLAPQGVASVRVCARVCMCFCAYCDRLSSTDGPGPGAVYLGERARGGGGHTARGLGFT